MDGPGTPLGCAWEALPYLDRIWRLSQLSGEARTSLLDMHRAGVLEEGDLSAATLRSLFSSGLGEEATTKVLSDFCDLASEGHRCTDAAASAAQPGVPLHAQLQRQRGWKDGAMLALLQGRQVTRCWPCVPLTPRYRADSHASLAHCTCSGCAPTPQLGHLAALQLTAPLNATLLRLADSPD
jgi:hypothetical protein